MKLKSFLAQWTKDADGFCAQHNLTRDDIKTGVDAWAVAHKTGMTKTAYDLPRSLNVVDAHIQSVLEVIFPNAVFKDKKRY